MRISLSFFMLICIAIVLVIIFVFFGALKQGIGLLGFSPEVAFFALVFMVAGSFVNIPIGKHKLVEVQRQGPWAMFQGKRYMSQGVFLNIGGAIVPLCICAFLFFSLSLEEIGIAVAGTVVASFLFSSLIFRGVGIRILVPSLCAAILAVVVSEVHAPQIAFIAGTLGVLIGADLARLPKVLKEGMGSVSIGGAGILDGIFLAGICSALLASLLSGSLF